MKYLLLYKGHYGATLRGPEMRYVSLALELTKIGHQVVLCGKSGNDEGIPSGIGFQSTNKILSLAKYFMTSNVIVLHGGGPAILFFSIAAGLLGKTLILDSYVPHWIELSELPKKKSKRHSLRILAKAHFNILRTALGAIFFNSLIVANKRQMDLVRGLMSQFSLTHDFHRVSIIPFGCSQNTTQNQSEGRELLIQLSNSKISNQDFLVGWLGGTYGWFDIETALIETSKAVLANSKIKLVFFGVDNIDQDRFLSIVDEASRDNILFLPWVDFSRRFEYWSGFDISLVWGRDGYENDYASRTRNFDCLTLGLPIIQNEDDEWGARLKETGAGVVTNKYHLANDIIELSKSPDKMLTMRQAMSTLAPAFYWDQFSNSLTNTALASVMPFSRRVAGLAGFILILPALFFFFVYSSFKILLAGRK